MVLPAPWGAEIPIKTGFLCGVLCITEEMYSNSGMYKESTEVDIFTSGLPGLSFIIFSITDARNTFAFVLQDGRGNMDVTALLITFILKFWKSLLVVGFGVREGDD